MYNFSVLIERNECVDLIYSYLYNFIYFYATQESMRVTLNISGESACYVCSDSLSFPAQNRRAPAHFKVDSFHAKVTRGKQRTSICSAITRTQAPHKSS